MRNPTLLRRSLAIAVAAAMLGLFYLAMSRGMALWRDYRQLSAAAAVAAAAIDQPPTDWQTSDTQGKPHALADYRGQVVVLDFWYAGCGHCQNAMPKLIALAKAFQDQPVAILGVNSDTVDEVPRREAFLNRLMARDARPLVHLLDAGEGLALHDLYHVTLYPTTLVLDQQGVVQHVHCGNLPWLESSLAGEIRTLLASAGTDR